MTPARTFLRQIDHAAAILADAALLVHDGRFTTGEYRDQTDALLRACTRVREAPYDDEARVELLRLTAEMVRSYDAPPGASS